MRWLTADADETLATDVLVVGGGLRSWRPGGGARRAASSSPSAEARLGGDARYYGPWATRRVRPKSRRRCSNASPPCPA